MGNIVTIKSKTKLGCNICDKCCINRGDIKITPINVIEISRYMNISLQEFINNYTMQIKNQPLEIAIKAVGNQNRCILNNEENNMCEIHPVKPMQCVTFPLVPIYLEKDVFYKQDTCVCEKQEETKVIDWLNGKDGIYVKYKKTYMKWIELVEFVQERWEKMDKSTQEQIFNILFYNYEEDEKNIKKSVKKNMELVRKIVSKIDQTVT